MVSSSNIEETSDIDKTDRRSSSLPSTSARMRNRIYDADPKATVNNGDAAQFVDEDEDAEWVPPDGGYGWVIVAMSFMLLLTFSAYSQIGIFLLELETHFEVSKTTISWINAAHTVTGRLLGLFTGQMLNRVGCRWVVSVGILLLSGGYFCSSFVNSIPLMFVTYGVIASIGSGCLYTTAAASVQQYFTSKRSLANGFCIAGTSAGIFAWPPLGQYLVQTYGWQVTFRIEAAIFLAIGIVIVILMRPPGNQNLFQPFKRCMNTRGRHSTNRPAVEADGKAKCNVGKYCDFSQLRNPALIIYLLGNSLMSIGHQMNSVYLPVRADLLGLPLSEGAWQSSVLGITGGVAKPIAAAVGNIPGVNRLVMASVGILLTSILTFSSTFMTASWMLLLNAGLLGFTSAMHLGVAFVNTVDVAGRDNIAVTGGLHTATLGVAHLILHPTTGLLLDTTDDPQIPFYFGGVAQLLSSVLVLTSMFVHKWRTVKKHDARLTLGGSTESVTDKQKTKQGQDNEAADAEIYVIHL